MDNLKTLLAQFKCGEVELDEVLHRLRKLPYEDLSFARIDHHRALRKGFPEVVYGATKSSEQIVTIVRSMAAFGTDVLVTRVDGDKARRVMEHIPEMAHHPQAGILTLPSSQARPPKTGCVMVLCAGSSDIPVAEEAAVTAEFMNCGVKRFFDVGVAGLHRLLHLWDELQEGDAFVVAAGMEGALPSVVGGLVERPVLAVPTSVGYGAALGGIAALLGMLNSCAPGVSVVNIDNGFGAGYLAAMIARCATGAGRKSST